MSSSKSAEIVEAFIYHYSKFCKAGNKNIMVDRLGFHNPKLYSSVISSKIGA